MRVKSFAAIAPVLIVAMTASRPRAWGLDFETEEVRFQSGGNTLAGTLHRPVKPGPHAALVLVLGSGPMDRAYGGVGTALARHFARHGFACLSWDRPGVGQSTGSYLAQSFRDRADEVRAAVRLLRSRRDIKPAKVGLWGHSQGGMVAPLAASLSTPTEVAFLIMVAGWQGPAWRQDPVRVEAELRAAGFAERDIARAVAFARRRMELIRGAGGFEELDRAQEAVKEHAWFKSVHRCDRALFDSSRRIVEYDSGPSWEQIRCPVLVIYGDQDLSSGRPEPLIGVIRRGLAKAGNSDLTVKIFPGADHSLCRARAQDPGGRPRPAQGNDPAAGPDFVPDYPEAMTTWLSRRLGPG
jgi:pimeloyl-ACP methyl ester carboxylesterase